MANNGHGNFNRAILEEPPVRRERYVSPAEQAALDESKRLWPDKLPRMTEAWLARATENELLAIIARNKQLSDWGRRGAYERACRANEVIRIRRGH